MGIISVGSAFPAIAKETRLQRTQSQLLFGQINREGSASEVKQGLESGTAIMDRSLLKAFESKTSVPLSGRVQSLGSDASLQVPANLSKQQATPDHFQLNAKLSDEDLRQLASRDVVLLIDRSSSMKKVDCPPTGSSPLGMPGGFMGLGESRWAWCADNVHDLSAQLQKISPNGVTLVLFSKDRMVFRNVDPHAIPQIFMQAGTSSGTNLVGALGEQLNEYRARRANGSKKPLMVAVLTDGLPSDFPAVVMQLVNAGGSMSNPDEIKVCFLQVGNSPTGSILLGSLDKGLVKLGSKYDFVDSKSFSEVQQLGLGRALLDSIKK